VLSGLPNITDAALHALLPTTTAAAAAAAGAVETEPEAAAEAAGSTITMPTAPRRTTGRLPCLVDLRLNFCPRLSIHAVHELRRQRPDILR